MPRKRVPSLDQQTQDRVIANAFATVLMSMVERDPQSIALHMALNGLQQFAGSAINTPKPRTRKATRPQTPNPVSEPAHAAMLDR